MISADNIPYDVLTVIFGYLLLPDLVAVSSVSRSFKASAEPGLFSSLIFMHAQAEKYAMSGLDGVSPFNAVLTMPYRLFYVRAIDLRAIPNERRKIGVFNKRWISDVNATIERAHNLSSFTCTVARAVPAFIPFLVPKSRLSYLRINAALPEDASLMLLEIISLRILILEEPTYYVLNILPRWAEKLSGSLLHLTITASKELNNIVLARSVEHLTGLLGLHISGCPLLDYTDVFAHIPQLPHLQSLATMISSQTPPACLDGTFFSLRHLALGVQSREQPEHTHGQYSRLARPSSHPLARVLPLVSGSSLRSLALKGSGTPPNFDDPTLEALLTVHGPTLQVLKLHDMPLSTADLHWIASQAPNMCKLVCNMRNVEGGIKDMGRALSVCKNLRVLIDAVSKSGSAATQGPRRHAKRPPDLTMDTVRGLMAEVECLKKIVCENRVWTAVIGSDGKKNINFERQKLQTGRGMPGWFMPPVESDIQGLTSIY